MDQNVKTTHKSESQIIHCSYFHYIQEKKEAKIKTIQLTVPKQKLWRATTAVNELYKNKKKV